MQAASQVPAAKLKFFSMLLSAITCGLGVACLILYSVLPIGQIIWPVFLILFCLAPDEKKTAIVSHKIGAIVCYVIFGVWIVLAAWTLISYILAGAIFDLIIMFAMQVAYLLAGLAGGLYYHNYKTGVALNGGDAPLLNNHV
jgi:hypothetical protein